MPRFDSNLAPRRLPGQGSLTAPWGPLRPSQSGPQQFTPSPHLGTSDNLTGWDPWSGNDTNLQPYVPSGVPAPLASRPALGNAYVTPSWDWNLSGPSGWDQGEWPQVMKGPNGGRYYAFGFSTPGQAPWGGRPQVTLSLPSVPPPQPFLGGAR